jgi:hypothetical protein
MTQPKPLRTQLLQKEEKAWRELPPAEYSRGVCALLDELGAPPHPPERIAAWLALVSAALRRSPARLVSVPACCAGHLLTLLAEHHPPARRRRLRTLFLLAWRQLGVTVARGPDSIALSAELPAGVVLPTGADPSAIADPTLRAEYEENIRKLNIEMDRWADKQHSLRQLEQLAARLRKLTLGEDEEGVEMKELLAALALVPGVPKEIRHSIQ